MIAGLFAVALGLAAPPAAGANPPVVDSVSYDSDGPADPTVAKLIEIRAGAALDPDVVRRTIQNLSATERYSQVAVEEEPAGEGRVALTVHLFHAFRVGRVRFESNPVSADELRRSLGYAVGDPYSATEREEGVGRLKRLLATEGYAEAEVTASSVLDRTEFEARITYRIRPGPTTRLADPVFDGDVAPFSPAVFLRKMHWKTGSRYREERARKSAQALQAYLLRQGRLKAEVRQIGVETKNHLASPVFRVEIGPLVAFETKGVEEKRVQKDFLNLLKDQVFQEDLLIQYVDTLRRKYQESGYRKAVVDYSIEESPGKELVVLTVARGSREWLETVQVEGVRAFPEKTVRRLLLTRPRSLFHRGYRRRGPGRGPERDRRFLSGPRLHAGGGRPPELVPGKKTGSLRLTLRVTEGTATTVRQVRIEGSTHTDPADLQKLLQVRVGQPYDDQKVDDDKASLVNSYRDHGWTRAAIEPRVNFTPDHAEASVTYLVTEGVREFFGKTIVRGNTRTRSSRVEFPIRWREGDPLSETKMLDAQRELSRTGVFQKVEVRPALPDPTTPERNILIDVIEARPFSLLYGLGYQYDDTTGAAGPFLHPRPRLQQPVWNASIDFDRIAVRAADEDRPSVPELSRPVFSRSRPAADRHRVLREGADFEHRHPASRRVSRGEQASVSASADRNATGVPADQRRQREPARPREDPAFRPEHQGNDRRGQRAVRRPGRNHRPPRGNFREFVRQVRVSVPALSATAHYLKAYGQISAYQRLFGGVLAASVRAGVISQKGDCGEGTGLACIPIAERLFSGGRTSNRAFSTSLEGIPGQSVDYSVIQEAAGTPGKGSCPFDRNFDCDYGPRLVGGAGTAGINLEWRFPILGDFGGTLFYDATQVWQDPRFHLHLEGPDGLRQSVGIGLRYLTPVGPIRLEYGRVLHPRNFDVPLLRFDPLTGAISDTGQTLRQKEPTSQLFVSIGYPF